MDSANVLSPLNPYSSAALFDLPPELAACAARHQQHLTALIVNLQTVGLDEEKIAGHIVELVSSYKDELLAALCAMQKRFNHD